MPHESAPYWLVFAAAFLLLYSREWAVKGAGFLIIVALLLPVLSANGWFIVAGLTFVPFVVWSGFWIIRQRFGNSEPHPVDGA